MPPFSVGGLAQGRYRTRSGHSPEVGGRTVLAPKQTGPGSDGWLGFSSVPGPLRLDEPLFLDRLGGPTVSGKFHRAASRDTPSPFECKVDRFLQPLTVLD